MPLWTPTEITTALWLDFSDASTVTLASGNVSQANDKSGNTRHASQANATFQPVYTAAGINGLNVATFDGTNDGLAGAVPLPVGAKSVFYVAKSANAVGNTILQSSSGSAPFYAYLFRMIRFGGSNFVGGDTRSVNVTSTLDFSTSFQSTFLGASIVSAARAWSFYYNDSAQSTSGTVNAENALGPYQVGNFLALVRDGFWPGMIGEIVVCSGEVTTETRQIVSGYLAWKWGIQSLLPADHPYKNAAPRIGSGIIPILRQHYAAQGAR
jgi:hypothetical protein